MPRDMEQTPAIWIKDPLAILAEGAERGIVVRGGKIVELVARARLVLFLGLQFQPRAFERGLDGRSNDRCSPGRTTSSA